MEINRLIVDRADGGWVTITKLDNGTYPMPVSTMVLDADEVKNLMYALAMVTRLE
jgi:hypothetical protein